MKLAPSSDGPRQVPARAARLLQEQAIDADQPGTILRDSQTFLDFIGPEGLRTTGRHSLLPHSCLGDLNARMVQPLDVRLKRPQQRSYPNLDGLYLVGRATGLVRACGSGAKGRLVVDEAVRESWNGLNPTEQYFTLLEAWLVHARPGMLGKGRGPSRDVLLDCWRLWESIPKEGLRLEQDRRFGRYLPGIGTEFQHLALMAMFGLAAVEQGPAAEGESWRPAAVRRLPWGDAVLAVLSGPDVWMRILDEPEAEKVVFGRLQGLFGALRPEWRNNLAVPQPAFRKGTFVLDVSLGPVRRLIALSARRTLEDLAVGILKAFEFDMDHLYSFTCTDRFGATVRVLHPCCEEPPSTMDVRLGDLPVAEGEAMEFLYDFGDCWRFAVRLKRVDPPRRGFEDPVVLEARGKAPPQYGRGDE